MRESYRLRVGQTREEEELIRQQAARREAGIEGRRSKLLPVLFKFSIRGRLRRALAGLGEGDSEEAEEQLPLLKETECPVCLQVK